MKETFCLDENQSGRLAQLVKHELVKLGILMKRDNLSERSKLFLKDEYCLYGSILRVLLKHD